MTNSCEQMASRRAFMGGAASLALLGMSSGVAGCASIPGFSLTDAIQRLMQVSSERAFARLTAPDGYWDSQIAQVGLDGFLGGGGGNSLGSLLTSTLFKGRLQSAFAGIAEKGSSAAAPVVAEAVRNISIADAAEIVRGGPTFATSKLRAAMGGSLINTMVPELGGALRIASDPLVGQAITALTGRDIGAMAIRVSSSVDSAIWREIGVEESAIRANPRATNDPLLIGVFGVGSQL